MERGTWRVVQGWSGGDGGVMAALPAYAGDAGETPGRKGRTLQRSLNRRVQAPLLPQVCCACAYTCRRQGKWDEGGWR
jgi:hypothetical protein